MNDILFWLVVADILLGFWFRTFSPKPLTQTHYDISRLSEKDIEDIVKGSTEKIRREIIEQRLKTQNYHDRQKRAKK